MPTGNILALETSGWAGSVAALDHDRLITSVALAPSQRSAQSLAPALKAALEQARWSPRDVDIVAVTVGPGSFTGLRVGVTTAKSFAYAVGAKVIGISTLDVLAEQAREYLDSQMLHLSVALDAQRDEVFASRESRGTHGEWSSVYREQIISSQAWLSALEPGTAISGPVLEKLVGQIPAGLVILPPAVWEPRAATVGVLAARLAERGQFDDLWQLAPRYLRRSAAEEKLSERS